MNHNPQKLPLNTILSNVQSNKISRPEYIGMLLSKLQNSNLHQVYEKWPEQSLKDAMLDWHKQRSTWAEQDVNDEAVTFAFQSANVIKKQVNKEAKLI